MKPTVGRIVHYINTSPKQGGKPFAAIVLAVQEETITLGVLTPEGGRFTSELPIKEGAASADVSEWWQWPPRDDSPSQIIAPEHFGARPDPT